MNTFKIDYEKLDVEAIMAQIRQRVDEKKGVVYTDDDLKNLGGLKLPSPVPPEKQNPDRDAVPVPEMPEHEEPVLKEIARLDRIITRRMQQTSFQEVQDEDFVTEALQCVGDWNVNIALEDLYRSSPGAKGKVIKAIRSINRKLFKLVMNIDVLFPQFHRQAVLNQTYVQLFHTLVKEISNLFNRIVASERDIYQDLDSIQKQVHQVVSDNVRDLSAEIQNVDRDLKQTRGEILRDVAIDKNDILRSINQQNEVIEQLHYKVDNLRGLIEGQKQQIEYLSARQRSLEKLAVLKEDTPEASAKRKSSDLEPGRYKPKENSEEK